MSPGFGFAAVIGAVSCSPSFIRIMVGKTSISDSTWYAEAILFNMDVMSTTDIPADARAFPNFVKNSRRPTGTSVTSINSSFSIDLHLFLIIETFCFFIVLK